MELIEVGEFKLNKVNIANLIADHLTNPLAPMDYADTIKHANCFNFVHFN